MFFQHWDTDYFLIERSCWRTSRRHIGMIFVDILARGTDDETKDYLRFEIVTTDKVGRQTIFLNTNICVSDSRSNPSLRSLSRQSKCKALGASSTTNILLCHGLRFRYFDCHVSHDIPMKYSRRVLEILRWSPEKNITLNVFLQLPQSFTF